MEILGIGPAELILIVMIALIVLGPQDTVRAGRNLGRAVRRFFSSEEWRTMLKATKEIRTIPDKLLEETGLDHPEDILPSGEEIRKEAGLDELEQNMSQWKADLDSMKKGSTAPPDSVAQESPNQILPPTRAAPAPSDQETPSDSGLQNLERDLSEWKADLSAWGSSPVIVPVPNANQNPEDAPAEDSPETPESSQETPKTAEATTPSSQNSPTSPEQDSQ